MQKKSTLDYIGQFVSDFTYEFGIISGKTTGNNMKIEEPLSIEYYMEDKTVGRFKPGEYFNLPANQSIDIVIQDEKYLEQFEKDLYSMIPEHQIMELDSPVSAIQSIFNRVNSMHKTDVNKELHLMVVNSKDGLANKNLKYVPEINTYDQLDDAKLLMGLRLTLLKEVSQFNNKELKYMVIVHIKYPILSLKMFNMKERKQVCGAIQYRRYLHYNEYDKMVTALHYDFPEKLIPMMEEYSLEMANRGLIL